MLHSGALKAHQPHKDEGIDDELIKQYLPLVKRQVARIKPLLPPSIDEADIVGYGMLGLLEAITRYDAPKGGPFESYAAARIRGAIVDGLRTMGWVPRNAYRKARQFHEATGQHKDEFGRTPPTGEESASELNACTEKLHSCVSEAAYVLLLPWEEMNELAEREERERSSEKAEMEELHEAVSKAVDELPDREKLVIILYFYERLTLNEIAKLLSITKGRACQLKAQALLHLKAALKHAGW